MKQRQSASHVKSWIFVCLVGNTEVLFSQDLIDFPLNHDHSDGEKQGQRIFKVVFFFSLVYESTDGIDSTSFNGHQQSEGTKSLWVSQVMNL